MMERLTEAQLERLYYDYMAYRDSLAPMQMPIGIVEFYNKNKVNYES